MAIIQSGASADLLTIDPTSKAARGTLYAADGSLITPTPAGSYLAGVSQRYTAATAINSFVFDMRGPAALTARLRRIIGSVAFDGTAAAAANIQIGLFRGSGAATATGGVAQTPSKKKSAMATSALQDFRYATAGGALTTTGITYESNPIWSAGLPASVTNGNIAVKIDWDKTDHRDTRAAELASSDHFALKLITAAIIGFHVDLSFDWD